MSGEKSAGARVSPLIPSRDEKKAPRSVYIRVSVWEAIDRIVETENEERTKDDQVTANRVIEHFLEWAIEDYDAAKAREKERKKK